MQESNKQIETVFNEAILTREMLNNKLLLNVFLAIAKGETLTGARKLLKEVFQSEKMTTSYRYVKRLNETKLIIRAQSLEKKRKYYALTERGENIYVYIVKYLAQKVMNYINENAKLAINYFPSNTICKNESELKHKRAISIIELEKYAKEQLQINPSLLRRVIDIPIASYTCERSFSDDVLEAILIPHNESITKLKQIIEADKNDIL